jgi:hypothetical protein
MGGWRGCRQGAWWAVAPTRWRRRPGGASGEGRPCASGPEDIPDRHSSPRQRHSAQALPRCAVRSGWRNSLVNPAVCSAHVLHPARQVRPQADVAGDVRQAAVQRDRVVPGVGVQQAGDAAGGAEQAEQDADGGGLAGAVGAQEAVDLAGADLQVQPVEGSCGPKVFTSPEIEIAVDIESVTASSPRSWSRGCPGAGHLPSCCVADARPWARRAGQPERRRHRTAPEDPDVIADASDHETDDYAADPRWPCPDAGGPRARWTRRSGCRQ